MKVIIGVLVISIHILQHAPVSASVNRTVCRQPPMTGLCKAYMPRFGYDGRACVEFIYGGCGGNDNQFDTKKECEKDCAGVVIPCGHNSTNCQPCQHCRKVWVIGCSSEPCEFRTECYGKRC